MKAIAAMGENGVIGNKGGLPWTSIKQDFKWFKEKTDGCIIIVGRVTFDSLPLLKNRTVNVLTNDIWNKMMIQNVEGNNGCRGRKFNYEMIVDYDQIDLDEMWVCGGKKIYELFLPLINEFYVTHVKGEYEGDTFMPPFEHLFQPPELIKEFDGHKIMKYSKLK